MLRYSSDSQLNSVKKYDTISHGFKAYSSSATSLTKDKSAESKMSKFSTFKLLSRTASILHTRQADLDSFMSGLNDRLESNNNDDVWDEVINFDDIDAANIDDLNEKFVETSTPSGELEQAESVAFEICNQDKREELKCSDFVSIDDKKRGFLRYRGKVHFSTGIYGGVELMGAEGSHDGQLEGVRLVSKVFIRI